MCYVLVFLLIYCYRYREEGRKKGRKEGRKERKKRNSGNKSKVNGIQMRKKSGETYNYYHHH
jgi:hypothetical protein